jgi:phosphoglucomutase
MKRLREAPPRTIPGHDLISVDDYKDGAVKHIDNGKRNIALPSSDVLKFVYSGGFTVVIRPSGTEPQLKLYYSAAGKTRCEALSELNAFEHEFEESMG